MGIAPAAATGPGAEGRFRRNVVALSGGQLVTWTMALAWTLVVPRALGPAQLGLLVTALSVTGILGLAGALAARPYLVSQIVVAPGEAPRLVGTAIALRALLTPLFVVAVALFGYLAHYGHEEWLVLSLAAVTTILTLLAEPMQAAFQAIERMEYLAYSDVINKSGQAVLGIAVALLGFRAVGVSASWVVAAGIAVLLDAYWLRPHIRVLMRSSSRRVATMARQSLPYWAFGVFYTVYLWIDTVMLSLMTNSRVVGWYGVPTRLFQTLMFLPVIVSTAWLPRLVGSFEHGIERLRQTARAPIELVVILSLPICAATALVARPMIDLLYGSAYAESVPVLIVLGLCIPPMYLNIMLNQVLIAAKRQTEWTWVMAGATVVNPLLNAGLIQVTQRAYGNGAIGAAVCLLLTELLLVSVGLWIVGRSILDTGVLRRCTLTAVAAAAMWAAGYFTRPLGAIPSLATGCLSFVALAWALRLVSADQIGAVRATAVRLCQRTRLHSGRRAAKRAVDLVLAVACLAILSPLLVGVAILIRLDDGGPALYRQQRIGFRGRSFILLKFRSMVVNCDDSLHRDYVSRRLSGENSEPIAGSYKLHADPRITRVGRWLRVSSIDELPQLLNVLRGEMSLVGPRPALQWEAELYPSEFRRRTDALPGITGLWQVNGRNRAPWPQMLRDDVHYVDNQSLWLDLRILLRTIPTVLRGDGAR